MRFLRDSILKTTSSLSKEQQLIIRAAADNLIADHQRSVKAGCELTDSVRRPDMLVKALRKQGLLPKTAQTTAEPFVICGLNRTALYGVTIGDLENRREAIESWIEFDSNFMHSGTEVFRLLSNMLMHGFKAGIGTPMDCPLSWAVVEYTKDPAVGQMLLSGGVPATKRFIDKTCLS